MARLKDREQRKGTGGFGSKSEDYEKAPSKTCVTSQPTGVKPDTTRRGVVHRPRGVYRGGLISGCVDCPGIPADQLPKPIAKLIAKPKPKVWVRLQLDEKVRNDSMYLLFDEDASRSFARLASGRVLPLSRSSKGSCSIGTRALFFETDQSTCFRCSPRLQTTMAGVVRIEVQNLSHIFACEPNENKR